MINIEFASRKVSVLAAEEVELQKVNEIRALLSWTLHQTLGISGYGFLCSMRVCCA